ncbi:MAG: aminopeptidase P family protein [Desulfovibrio sp.]|jgi:Xaa-Pro aminopeptidase|nr:aminopeptidase P family protein [Desulfovibrio sp.]
MAADIFGERRERLKALLRRDGLAALLVSLDANRYYLSGFELHDTQIDESAGYLVIMAADRDLLCTDPRFAEAAARLWDKDCIFIYQSKGLEQINALLRDRVQGNIGFEAAHISLAAFEKLGANLRLVKADGLVESLRMIKSADETDCLEKSCRLNHRLMNWLPEVLTPGRSESDIAWDIEKFFREHGAEEMAFPSIVGVNGNAALPHARPGPDSLVDGCCLLVDTGCRLDGYCSDQTRTFWVGEKADPLFTSDLEMVQEAQGKAIAMLRPGMAAADVYRVARAFLEDRGVADLFTHGLGHGIGLQTHEAPSLGSSSEQILRPGMVITVEPGLYRPGRHGVRWEYMVLVTEDGARTF